VTTPDSIAYRALLLFHGYDGKIASRFLTDAHVPHFLCGDMDELCREAERGAAAVLIMEEMLHDGRADKFKAVVDGQPAWSDLPVIILTTNRVDSQLAALAMERLGNVTVLERPVPMNSFLSVIRTSQKARRRQYEIRDEIEYRRRLAEELLKTNQELEQFAYVSSHDLKEPLRKISLYSDLLRQDVENGAGQAARYAENISEGARRMNSLIEDLLAYSRISKEPSAVVDVSLEDILAEVVSDLEAVIREKNAKVTSRKLPIVRGIPSQLHQILQNLVSNGIKFCNDKPVVTVSAERHSIGWAISVADNGIGIDPSHHERIFQVFSRLHTKERYPGTGIGLAICKKLVERQGGQIWVTSRPGEGSTFTFTVPRALGPVAEPADSPPQKQIAP
jgi:signal transduction histidine kinase